MEAFQEMCLEALSAGAVQSFVDLMYLASRGVKESSELESTRQCLLVSEAARRRGDTAGVIAQCTQLGRAFEASGDTVVSVFFVKRGLEVAKLTGDSASQLGCYHQLALSYERANDLDSALAYHDAHCGLAQQLGNAQQEVLACEGLARVFKQQAEASADRAKSLDLFQLALRATRGCGNVTAEADALYSCGRLCVALGQSHEALGFLEAYNKLVTSSPELSNQQSKAQAALAGAHEACGDYDAAASVLERLIASCSLELGVAGSDEALAEAAENLGILHARRGAQSEATRLLHLAYDTRLRMLSQGLGSRRGLDKTRVALGVVRGSAALPEYARLVASLDLASLLRAW